MPSDSLVIEISPALLESMGLSAERRKLDYLAFLGLERGSITDDEVDRAVMERTRALRPWQNSAQHGEEAIQLLPMLHRIASIIKDPIRCDAYVNEVDRLLRGERRDPLLDFKDMVRAALADGVIDQASKAELLRYANENSIPAAEAGRIVKEIADAGVAKTEAHGPAREELESKIAAGGEEAFRASLLVLVSEGNFTKDTSQAALAECAQFSVDQAEAAEILKEVRSEQFVRMLEVVAVGGVLNNNQARLLMPKALGLGLSPDLSYEILSQYTFTGASQDDLAKLHLSSASFDDSEIELLLEEQETVVYAGSRGFSVSGLVKPLIGLAAVAAIAAIGYLGLNILGGSGGGEALPDLPGPAEPVGTRADVPAPVPSPDEIAAAPTPAPAPLPDDPDRPLRVWELNTPDPPSGYIAIEPVEQGDPPAFWVKTHEVTNAEFRRFTADTFRTGTVEGPDDLPVTSVTIEDAKAYCEWVPKVLNLEPGQRIDLPTVAQFRRLMRAPVSYDRTAEPFDWPFYWRNAARRNRLEPPKQSPNDTLHFTTGKVYDLVGNVAEWGVDESDGRGVVLGGDYTQAAWDFDPLEPRSPGSAAPLSVIGFRYVILGPAGR